MENQAKQGMTDLQIPAKKINIIWENLVLTDMIIH
jgi:hypothetical protein